MDQEEMLRRLGAVVSELEELGVHLRQIEPVLAVYLAQAQTIVAGASKEVAAIGLPADAELKVLVDLTHVAAPQPGV